MNETRNQLLYILKIAQTKEDKELYTELLLERYEIDIKRRLKEIEYEKQELEDNLETLEFVRKKLGIKEEE